MRKHVRMRPAPHIAAVAAAVLILALLAAVPVVPSPAPPGTARDAAGDGGARLRVPAVVEQTTLVLPRHDTPPPWPRGNCFSLSRLSLQQRRAMDRAEARALRSNRQFNGQRVPRPDPRSYELQVLNMHTENFQRVVGELKIDTVEIERVGEQHCLIVDARIPRKWLLEVPCRHCTPDSLRKDLGSPHRAARFRKASP